MFLYDQLRWVLGNGVYLPKGENSFRVFCFHSCIFCQMTGQYFVRLCGLRSNSPDRQCCAAAQHVFHHLPIECDGHYDGVGAFCPVISVGNCHVKLSCVLFSQGLSLQCACQIIWSSRWCDMHTNHQYRLNLQCLLALSKCRDTIWPLTKSLASCMLMCHCHRWDPTLLCQKLTWYDLRFSVQVCVRRVNSSGMRTWPWGTPVLTVMALELQILYIIIIIII